MLVGTGFQGCIRDHGRLAAEAVRAWIVSTPTRFWIRYMAWKGYDFCDDNGDIEAQ